MAVRNSQGKKKKFINSFCSVTLKFFKDVRTSYEENTDNICDSSANLIYLNQ